MPASATKMPYLNPVSPDAERAINELIWRCDDRNARGDTRLASQVREVARCIRNFTKSTDETVEPTNGLSEEETTLYVFTLRDIGLTLLFESTSSKPQSADQTAENINANRKTAVLFFKEGLRCLELPRKSAEDTAQNRGSREAWYLSELIRRNSA